MDIVSVIKRYGKTSKDVADALETSPGYISQLGSGKTAPSIKKLDELAAVIGCKRWEFFLDEMEQQEVAAIFGLVKPAESTPQPQPQPAPEQQEPEQGADELPFDNGGKQMEVNNDAATAMVGLVRCPKCGHSIRLFGEGAE